MQELSLPEPEFEWDIPFQRSILSILLHDKIFLLQGITLIIPKYFVSQTHRTICSFAFEFFKRYNLIPNRINILNHLRETYKEDKSLEFHEAEFYSICQTYEIAVQSKEYYLDKILNFAKMQKLKTAFYESLNDLKDNRKLNDDVWNKIYDKIKKAMIVDKAFDFGLDYFNDYEERYQRLEKSEIEREVFTSSYYRVDCSIKGGGLIRGEIGAFIGDSGVGKCKKKGTPVLMYDGTIKKVEDIVVGDLVMGDDSTPRKILKLYRGIDEMYEIIPVKGDSFGVTQDHILVLKNMNKRRYQDNEFRVGDEYHIKVKDLIKQSKMFKSCMKMFRRGVDFKEKQIKINPYLLGIWLGDGSSRDPAVTTADKEIVEAIKIETENMGLNFKGLSQKGKAKVYSITGKGGKLSNTFLNNLRYYNLINNKHIPFDYLTNNKENRLQLLAGLIDSDGARSNNCFDFINKNKILAEQVVYLARSLGLAAYMKPSYKKSQNSTKNLYWRITISGDCSKVPVKLAHKRCYPRKQVKNVLHTGFEIKHLGKQPYYGFETDGNHKYLLGDFTVTHNSRALACAAAENVKLGKNVVYVSLELDQDRLATRFDSILSGVDIARLIDNKNKVFEELDFYRKEKNCLIIKNFPAGGADVDMLNAYLSQLEFHSVTPDLLIVDYVGEMKLPKDTPKHEARENLVRDLRGLAKEKNICVLTAMQPNRNAKETQKTGVLDRDSLADSYGQIRPLDCCWSLNQNDQESKLGIGRLYVIKHREGRDRFWIPIKFCPETLKIFEISEDVYKNTMSKNKKDDIDYSPKNDKDELGKLMSGESL